mmetsp:Transcript_3882/g.5173  ORF Transcript_3882/g.5173 Transcript_3882/m.5173 type:complete len:196 (+) Transcript_3882:203-790(+)
MQAAIAASLGESALSDAPSGLPVVPLGTQDLDLDLVAAIAASLRTPGEAPAPKAMQPAGHFGGAGNEVNTSDNLDLEPAIAASLQPLDRQSVPEGCDEMLATEEKRENVEEEPAPEEEGVVQLAIRIQDGRRLMRRFSKDTPIKVVFQFIRDEGIPTLGYTLETTYPRKSLMCNSSTLKDMEIIGQTMLNLVKKS